MTSRRPPLRPLGQPRVAQVRTNERGDPEFVRLPGKTARKVIAIRDRWRIDDEWWRRPISREYRSVVLDDGRVLMLFQDLVAKAWYVHKG